ncbi:hypothetical protein GT037_010548, partial [Alternaria burnsii]
IHDTNIGAVSAETRALNNILGWWESVPALAEAGVALLKLMALRPTAGTGHEMPVKSGMAFASMSPVMRTCMQKSALVLIMPCYSRTRSDACGANHHLKY